VRLSAKGWAEFQHYKDRKPPWIRLHRTLLDNKDFHRLPVESRALAPMLWLLASESVDGVIDATLDDLAFRLRSTERDVSLALAPLVKSGFFILDQDAGEVLALCGPVAVPESEAEGDSEALSEAEALQTVARPAARPRPKVVAGTPTAPVWNAYSDAYQRRYRVEPIRNAKVNGQLAQLIGRLGAELAPEVAAFYLTHNGRFYVEKCHAVDYLLRDCEKLHTEWATRRQVTATQAAQADKTQTNLNAFSGMLAEAREQEAGNGNLEVA
jgi:hypothetical protein